MRIKNKKTGELIEVPPHLESDVKKIIAMGGDPITILQYENIPIAQSGIKTKKPIVATDEYGNQVPEDWGNTTNYAQRFQNYLSNQYNDLNYMPDIQQDQFTPIQPLSAQQGLPNGQLSTKTVQQPFYQNADAPQEGEGGGFDLNAIKNIAIESGKLNKLVAIDVPKKYGNYLVSMRAEGFKNKNLTQALKQPYTNQFSEDMYGTNQGLQLPSAKMGKKVGNFAKMFETDNPNNSNVEYESGEILNLNIGGRNISDIVPGNITHETDNPNSATGKGITGNLTEGYIFSADEAMKTKKAILPDKDGKLVLKELKTKKTPAKIVAPFIDTKVDNGFSDKYSNNSKELHNLFSQPILKANEELIEMGKLQGEFGKKVQKEAMKNYEMQYGGKLPKAKDGWENLTPMEKLEWYKNSPLFNKDFFDENEFITNLDDPFWDDLYSENYKLYPPSKNVQLNTSPVINSVNQTVSTTNANLNTQRDLSWLKPFTSKTKVGKTTPTNVDLQGVPPQPVDWNYVANKWMDINPNINSPIELQEEMYDYWLDKYQFGTPQEKQEALKQFKTMWGTFGEVKFNSKNPPKGISKNWKNWKVDDKTTYDDLAKLRGNFMDAKLEARYMLPQQQSVISTETTKEKPTDTPLSPVNKALPTSPTKSAFNIPQAIPIPIGDIYGKEPIARFEIPYRNVPFRRISPQQQINEINRNSRAALTLLGNTPTDVSNIANILTQANIQSSNVIDQVNRQNIQNQMGIDQFNAQLDRQRDLSQLQEDVRFTDAIAKRNAAIQAQHQMNTNQAMKDLSDILREQRYMDFAEKIYPSKAWENMNLQVYDPTKFTLTPKEEKKKSKYGGKIKIKKKLTKKT